MKKINKYVRFWIKGVSIINWVKLILQVIKELII